MVEELSKPCPICKGAMVVADWEEGTSGLDYPVWECFDCGFEWNTTEAYWSRVYGYLLGIVREKLHDTICCEETTRQEAEQVRRDFMNAPKWPDDY